MAPWRRNAATADISAHGQVLRYDTAGLGSSFVLKFMDCGHNGGLCGAVPGPAFTVNTTGGPLTVRANVVPDPGRHHLAGTYDGSALRLYLNGELCAEQEGAGPLSSSDLPLMIGSFEGGTAGLRGSVVSVQVCAVARPAAEIASAWRSKQRPGD